MNESELQAMEISEEMARHFECLSDLKADMAASGVTFGSGEYEPSEKTCKDCRHYSDENSIYPVCQVLSYGVMCDESFQPKPDFGCNKWESKV